MTDEATVRLTDDGPVRFRGGGVRCERGETVATTPDHAASLVDTHGFERVSAGGEGAAACTVEKSDGEICGRERPCPYHDDQED